MNHSDLSKRVISVTLLIFLLPACTNPDLGSNALAITSPASGTSVSGTVAVQIGIAENTTATRIDLYVRGQGSTNKGMMVGSSVSEPHVISWNSLSQPNATNLELVAIAIDKEGKETPSPALPIRTQNSGTPQLQYLVGYTLAPKVATSDMQLSTTLLTQGVLPPENVDLSIQEAIQALDTTQRNYLLEWQWQPFPNAQGYCIFHNTQDTAGPFEQQSRCISASVTSGAQKADFNVTTAKSGDSHYGVVKAVMDAGSGQQAGA